MQEVFSECQDLPQLIQQWARLRWVLVTQPNLRPTFIAIDDDLKSPTGVCVKRHQVCGYRCGYRCGCVGGGGGGGGGGRGGGLRINEREREIESVYVRVSE